MKGRAEGVAKSIPQVNLKLEIFYTINKQGESGDAMRRVGRVGGWQWRDTELSCAEGICRPAHCACRSAVLHCAAQLVSTGMRRGLQSSVRSRSVFNLDRHPTSFPLCSV